MDDFLNIPLLCVAVLSFLPKKRIRELSSADFLKNVT
jgi:hypothetical protein